MTRGDDQELMQRLGYDFRDTKLLDRALTHSSAVPELRAARGEDIAFSGSEVQDNERLEFLGDAVVDLVVSHRLMQRFPGADEGELSKLRALIVNEDALAKVARQLHIGDLLRMGRGEELTGGRDKSSVLADALEAVLAAVYLTQGLKGAMDVVDRHFCEALDGVAEGRSGDDYKTRLQELMQRHGRAAPRYRVVGEEGPDHAKTFEVEVTVNGELFGRASGRNKKEAEQAAARKTLEIVLKKEG